MCHCVPSFYTVKHDQGVECNHDIRQSVTPRLTTCMTDRLNIVLAVDCWADMPEAQVLAIAALPADLHLHNCDLREPHPLMPAWPTHTAAEIVALGPVRVTYVGQHWNHCIQHTAAGMVTLMRFRPRVEIVCRPDLIRWSPRQGSGDRVMRHTDLGPGWSPLRDHAWRLDGNDW